MKNNSFTHLIAGLAAVMTAPALAIEAPADNAPPPPAPPAAQAAAKEEPATSPGAGYLGVFATDVPAMLTEHLGLKPGTGVLVRSLMPDGPAAKSGLAVNDVITRVGEQAITAPSDFTKVVARHKPGEKIHLELIHQGKPSGLDVTLGVRPEGLPMLEDRPLDQLNLEGMPKDMADRIRGAIQGNLGGLDLKIEEGAVEAGDLDEAMRDLKLRMEKALQDRKAQGGLAIPKIDIHQGATFRMMDNQGSIELRSKDGGKEVTLRDKDNKVTWSGPWDTEQDKAAAPAGVRQRVERLNIDMNFNGNGLRLNLQGINPQPPPVEDK